MTVTSPRPKDKTVDPEPCHLATVSLDDVGPGLSPPPYHSDGQSRHSHAVIPASITCCGCVNMRTGVFLIVICQLVFGILMVSYDMLEHTVPVRTADILLSYIVAGISGVVYLVLLYAASVRNWILYRRAAKLNVELFVVSAVLSYVTVGVGSRRGVSLMDEGLVIVSLTLVLVWLGYWTWILFKYAAVMEADAKAKEHRSEVSV